MNLPQLPLINVYARGYHVYMNIWNPVDEEILACT